VINFITRKDFSGAEIFGYYASPQDSGGAQARATLTAGYGNLSTDKFNAWLSFDYLDNKGCWRVSDRFRRQLTCRVSASTARRRQAFRPT
jgi:iron complex outermembrane receptor protein